MPSKSSYKSRENLEVRTFPIVAVALIAALAACSQPTSIPRVPVDGVPQARTAAQPVPCSSLRYMRDLNRHLDVVKNRKTGDSLEYVLVGDGKKSDEIILFFPGTGQDIADWPMQMITNSTYSPQIVKTLGYRADENGATSICHDYRLLFFDYPGVGLTAYRATATRDAIASDVDAILQRVGQRFGIATDTVDPLGWSLGTSFALKYAFLSPVSRPERIVHNVLLFAAAPGGSRQAQVGGNSALCILTLLDAAKTASGSVGRAVKSDATKLIFPYKGQGPKDNGSNSNCTATVSSSSVTLSVTPVCTVVNGCEGYVDNAILGLETFPWHRTNGVSGKAYDLQRSQSNDFDVAYCAKAARNFTSTGCVAYGSIDQSITNGGVCQTNTTAANDPTTSACDAFAITGKISIFEAFEDLYIQWTYDRALADGLNKTKAGIARNVIYPGFAGHGLLIQHPLWSQNQIASAMAGAARVAP